MERKAFNELYETIYKAYAISTLRDEYVRSTLGDVLDHLILLEKHKLITES